MSPVEGAGQGPRQNRMSAAITQGGTLGPETTRKEASCGQSRGLGALRVTVSPEAACCGSGLCGLADLSW